MKMTKKARSILFLFVLLIGFTINESVAQAPPPDGHGETTDQNPGGSAPITGGLTYLLVLGSAYGAKKWFILSSQKEIV